MTSDSEAWIHYPQYRLWFNKLWLSEKLGYLCGPNAVPVPFTQPYIIRPIYNLHGMGAGAQILTLSPEDVDLVPPGYFWCEVFQGDHYSVELSRDVDTWVTRSVYQGIRKKDTDLYRFEKWVRREVEIVIPTCLDELHQCSSINIEMIGNKIIEVHLRQTPDPVQYDELIPVWDDEDVDESIKDNYNYVASEDRVLNTNVRRLGFYCR